MLSSGMQAAHEQLPAVLGKGREPVGVTEENPMMYQQGFNIFEFEYESM